MGACTSIIKKEYFIALDAKVFQSGGFITVLPQFKMSFLDTIKKNYVLELVKKKGESRKFQLLIQYLDQSIESNKNQEQIQIQKLKQKYYDQTIIKQKEIQTSISDCQMIQQKLKQIKTQYPHDYVEKINLLKNQIQEKKKSLDQVVNLLQEKQGFNYPIYKEEYQTLRADLKSLVKQTQKLISEYKNTAEYRYTDRYTKNQYLIADCQEFLKNEAVRFQQIFSNINYFDKQSYQFLLRIKDKAMKKLSVLTQRIYFWEDKEFAAEIQSLINYKVKKEIQSEEIKEIYSKEGNYGYFDENQKWTFLVQDLYILNNCCDLMIDGAQNLIIKDHLLNQNEPLPQQDFAFIFDNINIDIEAAKINDNLDLGQFDMGALNIGSFEPVDFAGINNYAAAADFLGGVDAGGDWGMGGGNWGGGGDW